MTILIDFVISMCHRYWLCLVDIYQILCGKENKMRISFYRLNKSAIFGTVDSDAKIKIEVYNSIIHNVKKQISY